MDYFKQTIRPEDTWVYADEADAKIAKLEAVVNLFVDAEVSETLLWEAHQAAKALEEGNG